MFTANARHAQKVALDSSGHRKLGVAAALEVQVTVQDAAAEGAVGVELGFPLMVGAIGTILLSNNGRHFSSFSRPAPGSV